MTDAPFGALDFQVEIRLPGRDAPLCAAAFAECEGLELGRRVERVHEGGDARRSRLVVGASAPGHLTLRRGVTSSLDLWDWWAGVVEDPSLRADVTVALLGPDGAPRLAFALGGCVPVRLRGPRLHATGAPIAVEELELAAETLDVAGARRRRPPKLVRASLHAVGRPGGFDVPCNPVTLHRERGATGDRLSMTLHLDAADGDVRDLLAALDDLLGAPRVRFDWGRTGFEGRLTDVAEQLDHFGPDGRPQRATVSLVLEAPSWADGRPFPA